jgi:hypothetical protein
MRSSIIRAVIFILFICLSIALSLSISTTVIQTTAADPFYWEKMDIDLLLVESGDVLVTKTQNYVSTDKYTNQRNHHIKIDKIDRIQEIAIT